ncbi:MAG: LysM peptidoglycan-binding domain-containing protein [Desulfobacterales bacterium]|nr:LysM peptidoglycan-binding domain-containing protein [Desulfobacterales bacterium]
MKKKSPSDSKRYNSETHPNQKKNEPGASATGQGASLLKKNEFTMILIAALGVTALVFFFFFRGSSTQDRLESGVVSAKGEDPAVPGIEERISAIEISLAKIASASGQNENQGAMRTVSDLGERITRVETAVNLKLDTLIERLDKLESRLTKPAVASPTPARRSKLAAKKPAVSAKPPVPEKKVQVVKKKAKTSKPKKASQFHTVQKGETLWSISQKYKTNVAAIRKLNNLTPEDKIYPGTNLLVK